MINDFIQRFLIENTDIRGEFVRLTTSVQENLAAHNYHPATQQLLRQALTASVLMSATIKFNGKLSLQLQGDKTAALSLLVAECDSQQHIRGLAIERHTPTNSQLSTLIGQAVIGMTIHTDIQREPYQSFVALSADNLAECLENYFIQSEQLTTKILLFEQQDSIAGLFLQLMPSAKKHSDNWQRVCLLAESLSSQEAIQLSAEDILYRLFHQDTISLFRQQFISFQCGCSKQKMLAAVQTLGENEIDTMLKQQKTIDINCDFCGKQYAFDSTDLQES